VEGDSKEVVQAIRGGLLPIFQGGPVGAHPKLKDYPSVEELVRVAGATALWIKSPTVGRAAEALAGYPEVDDIELELADYDGFALALGADGKFAGKTITNAFAETPAQAELLLGLPGAFSVTVLLSKQTAPWLLGLKTVSPRLAVKQPFYERLTESAERDVDLREFFSQFRAPVPVENVPACVTGRQPKTRPKTLDTAMMTPDGKLEIFRYAKRYIVEHYMTKSLRCGTCVHESSCDGMHVNYVRAHGYGVMQAVEATTTSPSAPAMAAAASA
jgi:hypothetical protein